MTAQLARESNAPDPALSAAILRLLADARSAVIQDPHSADLYLEQATRLLRGTQASGPVPAGWHPGRCGS